MRSTSLALSRPAGEGQFSLPADLMVAKPFPDDKDQVK